MSGTPLQYNLVFKAIVVLFVLWLQARWLFGGRDLWLLHGIRVFARGGRLEPDAIAAGVLGGSLLTGGVGLVVGDLFGGLIEEMIQTLISQTLTSFNALSGFS